MTEDLLHTAWGQAQLRQFDALEIHPYRIIGDPYSSTEITIQCEPHQASFWSLYGHYSRESGRYGIESIKDFATAEDAQNFRDALTLKYPHLFGEQKAAHKRPTLPILI